VKGRKRHLVVDTQGFVRRVLVLPANIEDRDGALLLGPSLMRHFDRLSLIWADRAYPAQIKYWLLKHMQTRLEISHPLTDPGGRRRYPRRWVIERTFAWLSRYRRLRSDHELLPAVSPAFV
jgi:putative transposase